MHILTGHVCGMDVSRRNHRLCSAQRRKMQLLFRFPWRPASLFRPPKHTTPGEHTHTHLLYTHTLSNGSDDQSGKIMREMLHLPVYLYARLSCLVFCSQVHPVNTTVTHLSLNPQLTPNSVLFLLSPSSSSPQM